MNASVHPDRSLATVVAMVDRATPIRGEVRESGFRRVSHGLYRPVLPEERRRGPVVDLSAWQLVLPEDAVFTHITAAQLLGWWLPRLPEHVPVFAATAGDRRPRRAGLCCSRLERSAPTGVVEGLPVDAPGEVLLRSGRDLGLLDLAVMLDSARRMVGDQVATEVQDLCRGSRPGVRRLRAAALLSDARSESAWETLLRLFHVSVGIEVEPQHVVNDVAGRFVARADLLLSGTELLAEYDGGHHLSVQQQQEDLRRARRIAETSYVRRGYTADDLVNKPLTMLREIDRALGRPHRESRLSTWRHWLRESSYSAEGRRRLQNRWTRLTGTPDWARTA
jgi:very-short-patch-repair endonuclease